MTNAGFWFLFGAAFVSAAVISWIGFLELTYQRERRRSRNDAPATSLPGFQTAGAAREILSRRRNPDGFREQTWRGHSQRELKIAYGPAEGAPLKALQAAGEATTTSLKFCR